MRKNSFCDLIETQPNVILALGPSDSSSSISSSPNSSIIAAVVPEKTRWSCHKDILKSSSNYFDSIFNNQFQEAEASIVFLPRGIFSSTVLDDVLYFMYTKSIQQTNEEEEEEEEEEDNKRDDRNLEILEQLQSMYMAADYLGMDNLCSTIQQKIVQLTHGLICYCHRCTLLIPHVLSFTGPNNDPRLSQLTHSILKLLISDPEKTLPTFWSSPAMACLFTQSTEMESLHVYLQDRLLEHVNKNNAIETLHGCFLSLPCKDRVLLDEADWSPLVYTQKRIQQAGSKLLADHFDFYCTKYPKLLSCVDGITYSFEFLDYLLSNTLHYMNDMNACSLYKGIVRSLMCRDSVNQGGGVKNILQKAKDKTVRYIATHLSVMKELDTIDKNVIEQLAQDLVVPLNTLLDDDSKRNNNNKPGNNNKTNNTLLSNQLSSSVDHHKKKSNGAPLHIKLKSRLCTILFGQPTLNFKVGQRVQLLNRPVLTVGTILYVGKLLEEEDELSSSSSDKNNKKKIISINNNDYILGVELDRSVGLNDGSMNGKRYFTTLPNRGIFVKPSEVTLA